MWRMWKSLKKVVGEEGERIRLEDYPVNTEVKTSDYFKMLPLYSRLVGGCQVY